MSGKIVLIGENFVGMDAHPSVVGKIPGLYLQANYIEALLDDRYYRPATFLDYVMAFLVFAALEFILIVYRDQWLRIILFTAVLFLATYAVLYLFIKIPGWYVNPAPLGAIVILIKLLSLLFNRAEKEAKHSVANHEKPLSAAAEANLKQPAANPEPLNQPSPEDISKISK
jgi:CHASE2 domain-containing sensor protein